MTASAAESAFQNDILREMTERGWVWGSAAGVARSSEHSSSEHSPASSDHSRASSEHSSHRVEQIVQELRANPRL